MRISDLSSILSLSVVQSSYEDRELSGAYTSDLLSDVMANAGESTVLITIQAHKNTVAVASLMDIAAIIVCNDRPIPDDMINAAAQQKIGLFATHANQYEVSGRIYTAVELS